MAIYTDITTYSATDPFDDTSTVYLNHYVNVKNIETTFEEGGMQHFTYELRGYESRQARLDNYDNPAFTVIYTAEHDPTSDRTMVESAYLNLKESFPDTEDDL